MNYRDGRTVGLGDIVTVTVGPNKTAKARVVMLGEDYSHLEIEQSFLEWVRRDKVLAECDVVLDFIESNPFKHEDKRYSPVGNYMFTSLDAGVVLIDEYL